MNFRFLSIFILLIGILIAFAYYNTTQKNFEKNNKNIAMPIFPSFSLDSIAVSPKELNTNFSSVLIHFNSTCDHCQYEAQELLKNKVKLQTLTFLFIR